MTCATGQSRAEAVELARLLTQLIEFLANLLQEQVIALGVDVAPRMGSISRIFPVVVRGATLSYKTKRSSRP